MTKPVTRSIALLAALAAGAAAAAAASPPSPSPPPARKAPAMQEFAFIFRPTRAVASADLPKRNTAARDWALARRREGLVHVASPLEDGGVTVTAQAVAPVASDRAIGAVLIIAVKDLDAAVALAKTHPGLGYGTEIEVRPVKVVAPPSE